MKKGISLVALVITIIVLIILTTTVLLNIGGENSVINKAKLATLNDNIAQLREMAYVQNADDIIRGKNAGTLRLDNNNFFIVCTDLGQVEKIYFSNSITLCVYPTEDFNNRVNTNRGKGSIENEAKEIAKLKVYTEKATGGYLYTPEGRMIMGSTQLFDNKFGAIETCLCLDGSYTDSPRSGTTIENDGEIKAIYEDGYLETLGYILCTEFEYPERLNKVDDNLYEANMESEAFDGIGKIITGFQK